MLAVVILHFPRPAALFFPVFAFVLFLLNGSSGLRLFNLQTSWTHLCSGFNILSLSRSQPTNPLSHLEYYLSRLLSFPILLFSRLFVSVLFVFPWRRHLG